MPNHDDIANAFALHEMEASHYPTPDDLADARLDLEVERVERAQQWQACKERVAHVRDLVRDDLGVLGNRHRLMHNVHELVAALDELERLEALGGGGR